MCPVFFIVIPMKNYAMLRHYTRLIVDWIEMVCEGSLSFLGNIGERIAQPGTGNYEWHGIINGFPTLVHVYEPDACFSPRHGIMNGFPTYVSHTWMLMMKNVY